MALIKENRHPSDERLLDHSSGGADSTSRALIEAHLVCCQRCRSLIAELTRPAAMFIRATEEESPSPDLFGKIWRQVESTPRREPPTREVALPPGVLAEIPEGARLRWVSTAMGGSRVALLMRDSGTGSELYLTHMPGGRAFPAHAHSGAEEVVVLEGGYRDGDEVVETGDWVVTRPDTVHAPVTDPGEACWVLTRLQGELRFSGWRRWAQRAMALWKTASKTLLRVQ